MTACWNPLAITASGVKSAKVQWVSYTRDGTSASNGQSRLRPSSKQMKAKKRAPGCGAKRDPWPASDLKLSNVFLTRHGSKLLDFGLARMTDATFTGDPNQTRTIASLTAPGLIVGTPHYMAPEQADGLSAGLPADIFAVGSIFYEMLTGRRPFEGHSLVEVLYAVLHQNPPPLSGSREMLQIGI